MSVEQFDKILKKMKEIQDGGFNSSILLKHNIDILVQNRGNYTMSGDKNTVRFHIIHSVKAAVGKRHFH